MKSCDGHFAFVCGVTDCCVEYVMCVVGVVNASTGGHKSYD